MVEKKEIIIVRTLDKEKGNLSISWTNTNPDEVLGILLIAQKQIMNTYSTQPNFSQKKEREYIG